MSEVRGGLVQRVVAWLLRPFASGLANPERWLIGAVGPAKTHAGMSVTPDTAMQVAAVFACVRVLAEDVAKLPLILYRRRPDGGKERATDHPLYALLHDAPNPWQTSLEFREMMQAHLALRGNAYARITRMGPRVMELLPVHPARVTVSQSPATWNLTYKITGEAGATDVVAARDILHLRGLSANAITGLSPVSLARESIGLGLATERHGALLFANGAHVGGVYTHPKVLSDQASKRLQRSLSQYSGEGAHGSIVLEDGMTWTKVGMSNEDAQFLETRTFQIGEIARWFRIPPHKIGVLDRATFSNIEQQSLEYVTDTLLSWLRRWEQAIARDLLSPSERETYFAEFLVDGLLRGDIASRYAAYQVAVTNGWMSRNEVRVKENMNPEPGLDEFLQPLNMTSAQEKTA